MKVKKLYKTLQKAFPYFDIFVVVNGQNHWLANPSTALRKYGNLTVIDIERDENMETGEPMYFIKTKGE